MSYMDEISAIERQREKVVRQKVDCPTCDAVAGSKCVMDGRTSLWSHIDRYQLAVKRDLVPPPYRGAAGCTHPWVLLD